jgi:Ca-activated chloride channel family protein
MKTLTGLFLAAVVVAAGSTVALADGMIVPIRPEIRVRGHWAVNYHHVEINIRDQVASVSIDQEFENTGSGMIEVEYLFPVPPGAAVDSLTLVVDGKEYAAKLLKADEARRIYEDIVRQKKDPALLEYVGYGMYKTSAFPLQPNKPAKVIVTYKVILKKDRDLVEVWYPLGTEKFSARPVKDVKVTIDIKSKADISTVYSPTHDIRKDARDPRHVIVTYSDKDVLPTGDMQVFYREANDEVGATLLTHQPDKDKDGYFMALVSPSVRSARDKVAPKDVVLVFDRSGSMSGSKIRQAKEAMTFILKNLNDEDRFNVIAYNDQVETFFDELARPDKKSLDSALDQVDRMEARGGTNIAAAIEAALKLCPAGREKEGSRPVYIIFMTDGRPTVGKTAEEDILRIASKNNECKARIFCFGVGYDVNVRLLDKLAQDSSGRSDYVKEKEPIEGKISSFYAKIRNPVMTGLKLKIEGLRLRDMYPRELPDLFEGDQIVVVGRYQAEDVERLKSPERGVYRTNLVVTGMHQGRERGFEYPVEVTPGPRRGWDFVEKLWAVRRVGFLLDEVQLHGKNQEIIDELVRLSKEYGIMTPYTSFLADERTHLGKEDAIRLEARRRTDELNVVDGAAGQLGAANRQTLREAERPGSNTISGEALPAMGAKAGDLSGAGGAGPAAATAPMPRGNTQYGFSDTSDYEKSRASNTAAVQNIGNTTLYLRGQRWVTPQTANLDEKKDADKIRVIDRYSEEYFELARKNTAVENRIMASQAPNEELLVELRGQAYLIR